MPAEEVRALRIHRGPPPEGRRTPQAMAHAKDQLLAEAREITAEHVFALGVASERLYDDPETRAMAGTLEDLRILAERVRHWAEAAQETVTPAPKTDPR